MLMITSSTVLAQDTSPSRFVFRGETFFDRATRLEWQTCGWGQTYFEKSCIGTMSAVFCCSFYSSRTNDTWSSEDEKSWRAEQQKTADLVSRLAAKAGGPGWRMPTVSELETLQGSWSLPVKVENFMIGGHLAKETVCGRFQSEVSYCANRLVAIGPLGQHKHLEENSYIAELSSFLRLVRGPQQF
jgi:hypothetical protein